VSQKVDKTPPKAIEKLKQQTPAKSDDSSEIIEVNFVDKYQDYVDYDDVIPDNSSEHDSDANKIAPDINPNRDLFTAGMQ
jgi:hypothetical protein